MNIKIEIDDWLVEKEWPENFDSIILPYKDKFLQVKLVDSPYETNNE